MEEATPAGQNPNLQEPSPPLFKILRCAVVLVFFTKPRAAAIASVTHISHVCGPS